MILYIEKQAIGYKQTEEIINKFKGSDIIYIDNYKNIFDKNIGKNKLEKALIIAKINSQPVTKAPKGYGYIDESYFFKTSLNCVFNCSYCFLHGAFKSDYELYFVNYDDIKNQILKYDDGNLKWFYSSDYSDILGMNQISGFLTEFVDFFEKTRNLKMEIRTKSSNIKPILDLGFVPKNTEFAFSLNPQELIDKYEKGTSSLDARIKSVNELLSKGYLVGLRFLPLLPVRNYKKIYLEFVSYIKENIDISKLHSTFSSGLLYTKADYNKILKKYPKLDILYKLKVGNDGFVRETREQRDFFYNLFKSLDEKCYICLDN